MHSLHAPLPDARARAGSVREAFDVPVPGVAQAYEQQVWLHGLHETLAAVLTAPRDVLLENPYFVGTPSAGQRFAQQRRIALVRLAMDHAEALGSAQDAARVPGWNRLMMCWLVGGQLAVLLHRLQPVPDDAVHVGPLLSNELCLTPRALLDVHRLSMRELRLHMDLLRDRLYCVRPTARTFAAVWRYVALLEIRAAEFALGIVPPDAPDALDEPAWRGPSRAFVATMAWHFVWIRRTLWQAQQLASVAWLADAGRQHGRTCAVDALTERRAAVLAFAGQAADGMTTRDHLRAFAAVATLYNVAPGDLDAHSHVFGMAGAERATVRDVVSRRRCANATPYAAIGQWKRPLRAWRNCRTV